MCIKIFGLLWSKDVRSGVPAARSLLGCCLAALGSRCQLALFHANGDGQSPFDLVCLVDELLPPLQLLGAFGAFLCLVQGLVKGGFGLLKA